CNRARDGVFEIFLGEIEKHRIIRFTRFQCKWRLQNRGLNLSRCKRGPTVSLPADTNDLNVLLGIEAEPSNRNAGDEIRARSELADSDPLALEVFRTFDRRVCRQNVIQTIADRTDELKILRALSPGGDNGRSPLQLQRQIARERRLNPHQATTYVDRLEFQSVFFKRTGAVGDPKITGRPTQRITHLDLAHGFGLRVNHRWPLQNQR